MWCRHPLLLLATACGGAPVRLGTSAQPLNISIADALALGMVGGPSTALLVVVSDALRPIPCSVSLYSNDTLGHSTMASTNER